MEINKNQILLNTILTGENDKTETYLCPMHPEVKSYKPGKCPKCGMNLETKD